MCTRNRSYWKRQWAFEYNVEYSSGSIQSRRSRLLRSQLNTNDQCPCGWMNVVNDKTNRRSRLRLISHLRNGNPIYIRRQSIFVASNVCKSIFAVTSMRLVIWHRRSIWKRTWSVYSNDEDASLVSNPIRIAVRTHHLRRLRTRTHTFIEFNRSASVTCCSSVGRWTRPSNLPLQRTVLSL